MLTIIVTTLFISLVINVGLKKYQLPTIIGYIFTGTIVAYGFNLHDAVHNRDLKEIAEFGVVFLMFTIGLEFSLQHLKRMKYEVFVTGTLQIALTASAAYLFGHYLFGIAPRTAFILAVAVALSSTAIVLKSFNESGEITRRHGQRALGILIMQDIAVIPILLVIGFMSSGGDLGVVLSEMALSAVILLALLWAAGKYLLEPLFRQIVQTHSDELFMGTILFLAIGASYLAHLLGFSYSLGAFMAGMLIAETRYKHQAEADLIPFRDLLLGVFFITVGMQIDFAVIGSHLLLIAVLLPAVLLLKFALIYPLVRLGENAKVSFKTALSLVQIGEFSLALLELARSNGLVGPPYGQVMIVTVVLSMILTPFILKNLSRLTERFFDRDDEAATQSAYAHALEGHTVILGFGEFGQSIADALKAKERAYLAIENNIVTCERAQKLGEPVIFGNALKKEVLRSAGLPRAKHVIVAINDPRKLYHLCQSIQSVAQEAHIIAKVHNSDEKRLVNELGITAVIVENEIAAEAVTQAVTEE